jgi:hypothetical protein
MWMLALGILLPIQNDQDCDIKLLQDQGQKIISV